MVAFSIIKNHDIHQAQLTKSTNQRVRNCIFPYFLRLPLTQLHLRKCCLHTVHWLTMEKEKCKQFRKKQNKQKNTYNNFPKENHLPADSWSPRRPFLWLWSPFVPWKIWDQSTQSLFIWMTPMTVPRLTVWVKLQEFQGWVYIISKAG